MTFDFSALLLILTVVSGITWAVDAKFFAPRRLVGAGELETTFADDLDASAHIPWYVDICKSLFPVFLAVLLLRSFVVEPFRIPSNSMMPTLLTGDFILVNKFSYGLRLPVLNQKFLPLGAPGRGDVVVFRYPGDGKTPYIKRIVGVPGDKVAYRNKTLFVNDVAVESEYLGRYLGVGSGRSATGSRQLKEFLPGQEHNILVNDSKPDQALDATFNCRVRARLGLIDGAQAAGTPVGKPCALRGRSLSSIGGFVVPEGEYFVMGDNRDNSLDSRYWGTVADQMLVGKAFVIWMNFDFGNFRIDFGRLGDIIH